MKTLTIVLAILVALIYVKFVVILLMLPVWWADSIYRKNKFKRLRFLAAPNYLIERFIGGGGGRVQILYLQNIDNPFNQNP